MSVSEKNQRRAQRLQPYVPIFALFRSGRFSEGNLRMNEQLQQIDDTDDIAILYWEFVSMFLNSPILYIKLLLTFVYWKTWNKVEDSEVIAKFFSNFQDSDNARLHASLGSFNNTELDRNVEDLKETGREWYTTYIQYILRTLTVKQAQDRIDLLVFIADHLMGDNVGTKALQSCEVGAFSASTNNFINFLGCIGELVPKTDANCVAIQRTIDQFMENLQRGSSDRK